MNKQFYEKSVAEGRAFWGDDTKSIRHYILTTLKPFERITSKKYISDTCDAIQSSQVGKEAVYKGDLQQYIVNIMLFKMADIIGDLQYKIGER